MDPASLSQRQLCQWAEEMGYLLPTGRVATTVDLAAATSTPNRRRLCDIIVRCFKDRRLTRKIKENLGNKTNFQSEKVEILRSRTEELEQDIGQLQQKIIQRIKKIRNIEQISKELQIKILLFNKFKTRNILEIKELERRRKQIENISSDTNITQIEATEFLERNVKVVRKDWFDPVLLVETMEILTKANMMGDGMWKALCDGTDKSVEECHLQNLEAQKQLSWLRSQMDSPINWINHVAKQKINTIVTDGVALLLRGAGIKKMADESHKDKLEKLSNIICTLENNKLYPSDHIDQDESILNKWSNNYDESLLAYNHIKNKSRLILSKYQTGVVKSQECGCSLNKMLSEFSIKLESNTIEWRSLLQKSSMTAKQHMDIIWHFPLSQIRKINGPKPTNLLRNDFLLENITLKLVEGMSDSGIMDNYVRELEKKACLDTNSDHRRKFIRNLEKTRSRAHDLNDINQKINRTIKIFSEQPFANMIPNSFTVSNLTFKEWRLQFNLMCTPRRK